MIVLGLAVLLVLVLNLNVFDQGPDEDIPPPSARASGAASPNNAVVFLLGLNAPSDRDPLLVGAERLGSPGAVDEPASTPLDQRWIERYPASSCNTRNQLGCLARLRSDLLQAPLDDARLALLLERYRDVRRLTVFDERPVLQADTAVLPEYSMLLRLARMNVAVRLQQDGVGAALDELRADRAFWERMLEGSDSMLARMVAVAGLWTELQFVSELVAAEALTINQLHVARAIVEPLSASALDLGPVFSTEQRSLDRVLAQLRTEGSWIHRLFVALTLQPNATRNRFDRELTRPMIELAGVGPAEFRQRVQRGVAPDFEFRVFPPALYNLGGTLLLQRFRSYRPWDYIGRVHDLSGMHGLVRLQIELAERGAGGGGGASIERQVEASPERDPYSGEAVHWDPEQRALSIDCYGESVCEVRI